MNIYTCSVCDTKKWVDDVGIIAAETCECGGDMTRGEQSHQAAEVSPSNSSGLLRCAKIAIEKAEGFERLAGEILATLDVNLGRGDLCKPEAEEKLKLIVSGWIERQRNLKAL